MTYRPLLFQEMGRQFSAAFGNCDAVFTIAGVVGLPVRVIVRSVRVNNEAEESGHGVEAVIDNVSVAAAAVPGLTSQRDAVTIGGRLYPIRNIEDDGRAMLKLFFRDKLQ